MVANDKIKTAGVMTSDACLVYATFPSTDSAEAVGRALVASKLAACVNILPAMTSLYEWQGTLHREAEVVMLIKTVTDRAADVVASVRQSHPYDNPAILVLPIMGGSMDFLRWISAQTSETPSHAGEA